MISIVNVKKQITDPLKAGISIAPKQEETVKLFSLPIFAKHLCNTMHFLHTKDNYRFQPPQNSIPKKRYKTN